MFKLQNFIFVILFVHLIIVSVHTFKTDSNHGVTVQPCKCNQANEWTYELKKVCGTDGQTYANKMQLICANQCNNSNVAVAYEGECKKSHERRKSI